MTNFYLFINLNYFSSKKIIDFFEENKEFYKNIPPKIFKLCNKHEINSLFSKHDFNKNPLSKQVENKSPSEIIEYIQSSYFKKTKEFIDSQAIENKNLYTWLGIDQALYEYNDIKSLKDSLEDKNIHVILIYSNIFDMIYRLNYYKKEQYLNTFLYEKQDIFKKISDILNNYKLIFGNNAHYIDIDYYEFHKIDPLQYIKDKFFKNLDLSEQDSTFEIKEKVKPNYLKDLSQNNLHKIASIHNNIPHFFKKFLFIRNNQYITEVFEYIEND